MKDLKEGPCKIGKVFLGVQFLLASLVTSFIYKLTDYCTWYAKRIRVTVGLSFALMLLEAMWRLLRAILPAREGTLDSVMDCVRGYS